MSDLKELLDRNHSFATSFALGDLPIHPRMSITVLTCLDARMDPAHFLGLDLGDALVLRNAGGRVSPDVERDLALLWFLAIMFAEGGAPHLELAIVHHTDCGVERLANPDARRAAHREVGLAESLLEQMAISDHEASLRDDIERLRQSPIVPDGLVVSGHIYDVKNGKLRQVFAPAPLSDK